MSSPAVATALSAVGDPGPALSIRPVGGGCINEAYRVETAAGLYFLKTGAADMYVLEAHGLNLLADTHTLTVPRPLHAVDGVQGYLLLPWIETGARHGDWARRLGHGLAQLHGATEQLFGLDRHNFIGANPQKNDWCTDWIAFFREQRLLPQARMAQANRLWNGQRDDRLTRVCQRLGEWLPAQEQAVLVHGDLWSGNVMVNADGLPCLIDPAVYYGAAETDLAMTTLFGGFPPAFYKAYFEVNPRLSGWADRYALYNLYHQLNHLNLFGESYGPGVDSILSRYC